MQINADILNIGVATLKINIKFNKKAIAEPMAFSKIGQHPGIIRTTKNLKLVASLLIPHP